MATTPVGDTAAQAATIRTRGRDPISGLLAWVRSQTANTPGRLLLIAAGMVAGAIVFWAVASASENSRGAATDAVATRTEQQLVQAVQLYSSLSDADATAATTFLLGGLEPPARRARYLAGIDAASTALAELSSDAGASRAARAAARTVTSALPTYAGLVETARAYNREGLPIGAAYLRQASGLLAQKILPAAKRIYAEAATRLADGYNKGTSLLTLVVFIAVAILALAAIARVQVRLYAMSRRVLSVPVVAASAGIVILTAWGAIALLVEQSALARAQRDGSDPVEALATTQILVSRLESDQSLTLVARGGDPAPGADFDAVLGTLDHGLLSQAHAMAQRVGGQSAADELTAAIGVYRHQHARIASLVSQGETPQAIAFAVGTARSASSPSDRLTRDLVGDLDVAQRRFTSAAGDATGALSGLSAGIPVFTLAIAGLALLGVRVRMREYA